MDQVAVASPVSARITALDFRLKLHSEAVETAGTVSVAVDPFRLDPPAALAMGGPVTVESIGLEQEFDPDFSVSDAPATPFQICSN